MRWFKWLSKQFQSRKHSKNEAEKLRRRRMFLEPLDLNQAYSLSLAA